MPILQYGRTSFEWRFQLDNKLKRHYVTVERGRPVLLRGPAASKADQEALVRHRARWIRDKLALVNQHLHNEPIVTGSRLRYCGRTYFTEVRHAPDITQPRLTFTASRFIVEHPGGSSISLEAISPLLDSFYSERAHERLPQRVRHWERLTGLQSGGARIRHFESRWASCNPHNVLEFHPRVMELASTVQDYVIVHELCHTVEKNHTKAFWSLVAQHLPDWRHRHAVLEQAAFGDAI